MESSMRNSPTASSTNDNNRSTERSSQHPIHLMLASFPLVCFVGALLTDIAYWQTAEMMWADFSAWLLAVGLLTGVLAAIAGIIASISSPSIRRAPLWLHVGGNLIVLGLAFANSLIHSRDAWTSVVPTGLMLSALTVLVLLATEWMGWTIAYPNRVGVPNS